MNTSKIQFGFNLDDAGEPIALTDPPSMVDARRRFYELDLRHEQLKAEINANARRREELTGQCERVMDEKSQLAREIFRK